MFWICIVFCSLRNTHPPLWDSDGAIREDTGPDWSTSATSGPIPQGWHVTEARLTEAIMEDYCDLERSTSLSPFKIYVFMYDLPACMSVHPVCLVPTETERALDPVRLEL